MTLVRALSAEALKMKRTVALRMVVLAPVVVVVLVTFLLSQMPSALLLRRGTLWMELTRTMLGLWATLMMPLFITIETALIAGLDHSENQWKNILALPVPRWTIYIGKLLVACGMVIASTFLLMCGVLMAGAVLPYLRPELIFGWPPPWLEIFTKGSQVAALSATALATQHWISVRWRSFPVPVGVGVAAVVVGVVVVASKSNVWELWYPWAVMTRPLVTPPTDLTILLWTHGLAGIAIALIGCWTFCRRESD